MAQEALPFKKKKIKKDSLCVLKFLGSLSRFTVINLNFSPRLMVVLIIIGNFDLFESEMESEGAKHFILNSRQCPDSNFRKGPCVPN